MTHPEIKVSRVSSFLKTKGTLMYAENADLFVFISVNQRTILNSGLIMFYNDINPSSIPRLTASVRLEIPNLAYKAER